MANPTTVDGSNDAKPGAPLIGPRPLEEQIRLECEAMTKYALASGIRVPASVVQALEVASGLSTGDGRMPVATAGTTTTGAGQSASFGEVVGALGQLVTAHEQLSQIVAPSTPRTLLYLASEIEQGGFWKFLGPVRAVRGVMLVALAFLLAFIVLALTPGVRPAVDPNVTPEHPAIALLFGEFYLLCAAGMGATFSALFEANRYIVNYTFDPRYKGYYWIKIVLGLTAGYILAHLIPLGENSANLGKPTLAMLGGFSGTVVYNILNKLANSVESMVQGDPQSAIAAQQTAAKARAAEEVSRAKVKQATGLMGLQNMLGTGATNDEVQKKITQLVSELGLLDVSPTMQESGQTGNGAVATPKPQGTTPAATAPAVAAEVAKGQDQQNATDGPEK
jgi:hypothetical protein